MGPQDRGHGGEGGGRTFTDFSPYMEFDRNLTIIKPLPKLYILHPLQTSSHTFRINPNSPFGSRNLAGTRSLHLPQPPTSCLHSHHALPLCSVRPLPGNLTLNTAHILSIIFGLCSPVPLGRTFLTILNLPHTPQSLPQPT